MPCILCTLLTHATYKFLLNIAKRGCVLPLVIWPAFRMEHNRVNGHPYHASLFRITVTLYICNFCTSEIFLKLSKSNFSALEMVKQLPILLLICEIVMKIRGFLQATWKAVIIIKMCIVIFIIMYILSCFDGDPLFWCRCLAEKNV